MNEKDKREDKVERITEKTEKNKIESRINIFYACDNNFVKYAMVSVRSLIENADKNRKYHIHILSSADISEQTKKKFDEFKSETFKISFESIEKELLYFQESLPIRDYYTKTTYFRLFIADMFPSLEKAIYIDSDTVVLGDISKLYDTDIKNNSVGVCHEQVMLQTEEYGLYVEKVCGINRELYFNAGVLLINCNMFRERKITQKFTELLFDYNFVVTQDEDYLNVLCQDRVYWLDSSWNTEMFGVLPCKEEEINIIHYIMTSKPWHYIDCRMGEYFWKYAALTPVYDEIKAVLDSYTDEQKEKDRISCDNLLKLAINETEREDAYYKVVRKKRAADREEVLEKIEKMEKEGVYDIDPENDPPTKVLYPDKVDYLREKRISKIKTKISFAVAKLFVNKLVKDKKLIIKDIVGIENWENLKSGAIITCNHFNAFDSFAIHLAYFYSKQKSRKFFRIIREGNYTNFPGIYGFFMRNCNTLPLSSNLKTAQKLNRSIDKILKDGHFILVYPEQAMWWNYRKKKKKKNGAFKFAVKNNVPVLPCFITMKNSEIMGEDGFYVQEYTVHVGKPIYPDSSLCPSDNVQYLQNENSRIWKEIYENFYGIDYKL